MADEQGLSVVIGADTTPLIRATQQADSAIAGFATQTAKRAEAAAQAMEAIASRANPALVAARREWGALERAIPGTTAALAKLKLVTEQADAALQAGRITAEQHGKAVSDLKLRYDANAIAAKKAAEEEAKGMAALQVKAQSLKDALDPTSKAQREFAARVAEADQMLASGLITYGQHADAVRRYRAALDQTAGTHETVARSTKLAAHEVNNLTAQATDFAVQVGSGQGLFRPLLQQAPQAVGAVGGVGRAMALLATPTALVAAGIAAVAGTGALVVSRMVEMSNEAKRLTAQVGVLNPGLAVTAEQLRQMSFAVANQGTSRSEGMAALTAVIGNARIQSAGLVEQIAKLSVDLAALKGGTAADWATKLADAAGKGAQGFSDLGDTLPGLTANTLAAARAAEAQGDRLGAAKLAMAELEQQYGGSAKQMKSDFGNAVDEMSRKWDTLLEHMANSGPAKASIGFISGALEGFDRWLNGAPAVVEQATKLASVRAALDRELASLNDLQDQGAGGTVLDRQIKKVQALQTEYFALANAVRAASGGGGGAGGTNGTGAGGASGGPQPPITGAIVGLNERDKDKLNLATDAMKRQAEGAKLLSQNLSVSARATAENRIALADLAMQYPGLGAGTANAILTSKDFAATLKTLPQPLQDVFQAMERNSANKLAGDLAMATVGLTSEANAAKLAAEAAGLGEAAMRKASIEAEVYAHRMDGTAGAVRAAREQQEQFVRQQIRNEFARGIDQEIAANQRLVVAYGTSGKAVEEASRYNEAYVQTLREVAPGEDGWTEALDRNIKKLKERDLSRLTKDIAAYGDALRKSKEDAQVELSASRLGDLAALELRARYDALKAMGLTIEKYQLLDEATRRNVDIQLEGAAAIAKQRQEVDNYKSAWDTVTGSLEKSFERIGDALVQAMVSGQKASINLGTIWKSIAASFLSDIAKLASVDLRRMIGLGGNTTGSLLDLLGGSSAAQGSSGGLSLNNLFSLGSMGNNLGLFGDTFSGIGSSLSGLMSTPLLTGTSGIAPGFVDVIGATQIANTAAMTGGGLTLGGFLGGAGLGMGVGSLLNSLVGGNAVGGTIGSGLGAGAGALIGSLVPGIGTLIGGLIGGAGGGLLGGLFGNNKPSTEYGGAFVDAVNGNVFNSGSGADQTASGKIGALEQRASDALKAINSVVSAAGLTLTGNLWLGTESDINGSRTKIGGWNGKQVSTSEDPGQIAADVLRYLANASAEYGTPEAIAGMAQAAGIPTLTGNSTVLKALRGAKDFNNTDLANVLTLAKGIVDATAGLDALDKSLAGVASAAKKQAAAQFDALKDSVDLADRAGIGGEYRDLLTRQLRASLDPATQSFTEFEVKAAQIHGAAQAATDAIHKYSLAINDNEVAASEAAQIQQLATAKNSALNVQLAEALGHGFINQINDALSAEQINARDLTAVGQPITRAQELRAAQLNNILKGLTAGELDFVTATYGATSDIGKLAQAIKVAGSAASGAASAFNADLTARMYAAVGNDRTASLLRLDAQQAKELADAQAAGYDTTRLSQVLGAERGKSAFDLALKDYQDGIDREIRAINDNTQASRDLATANSQFALSVRQAANDRLINKDISPLSPLEQLKEARRQVDATFAAAMGGDTDARGRIISLLNTRDQLARNYYASSDSTDFYDSQRKLESLGITAEDQLSTAELQVKKADEQIRELQRQRDAATRLGERQLGALGDLKNVLDQSYAVWQAALAPLQSLTGTTSGAARYQAPAAIQGAWDAMTTGQRQAIAQTLGWTQPDLGTGFNAYVAMDPNRIRTFEQYAVAIGGGQRYAAPDRIGQAWEALNDAQRTAALRAAGYSGVVDDGWRGANAWVSLGHQQGFEAAMVMTAHNAGVPGFAAGGYHAGGLRLVGEYGPELEVTGPSRIWNAEQTRALLAGSNDNGMVVSAIREGTALHRVGYAELCKRMDAMAKELADLKAENAAMRREVKRGNTEKLSA